MKKLSCLFACLIAHAAQAAAPVDSAFTGFYLTARIGGTSASFDVSPDFTGISGFPVSTPGDYSLNNISAAGSLGVGYLYQVDRFVLGVEATAGYMDAQQSHDTHFFESIPLIPLIIDVESNLEAKLTNDFALLFKPGVVFNKSTLLYALLGPRWGNFETTRSANVLLVTGGSPGGANGSQSESGYHLGFTAGAGIQQMLTDHVHLALEYAFTAYGNIDSSEAFFPAFFGSTPVGESFTDSTTIDAQTNTVMVSVSYQW